MATRDLAVLWSLAARLPLFSVFLSVSCRLRKFTGYTSMGVGRDTSCSTRVLFMRPEFSRVFQNTNRVLLIGWASFMVGPVKRYEHNIHVSRLYTTWETFLHRKPIGGSEDKHLTFPSLSKQGSIPY